MTKRVLSRQVPYRKLACLGMGIMPIMSEGASASPTSGVFPDDSGAKSTAIPANPRQAHNRKDADPIDKSLIARSQIGDIGAFNELVHRYEKSVYNFAYRLTNNYDDANDIAQDAFVRAYSAIGNFRGDSSFSTWIFRITTNVFLDERKKSKAHPQQSLDEFVQLEESNIVREIEDPSPTPEAIASGNERTAILNAAIESLPGYQRTMVMMYHGEQRSYEEIAEIMELPIGTVKSRLNRARLALKEKLLMNLELLLL